MAYYVLPAQKQEDPVKAAASFVSELVGAHQKIQRRKAVQEALTGQGYEAKTVYDEDGNAKTTYEKPNLSLKEKVAKSLGYENYTPEQHKEAYANDPQYRAVMAGKTTEPSRADMLANDLDAAAQGKISYDDLEKKYSTAEEKKKVREAEYANNDQRTKDFVSKVKSQYGYVDSDGKKYKPKDVIKMQILDNTAELEKKGVDVKGAISMLSEDIQKAGLQEEIPEKYRGVVSAPAKKKKKFNWSSILSPMNLGGSLTQ